MAIQLVVASLYLDLPPTPKLVIVALAERAREDGTGCHPGNEEISVRASVSVRQVRRILGDLEDEGWIKRDGYPLGGHGMAVRWRLDAQRIRLEAAARGWNPSTRTRMSSFSKQPGHPGSTTGTPETDNPDTCVPPTLMNPYEPDSLRIQEENPKPDDEPWSSYMLRIAKIMGEEQ